MRVVVDGNDGTGKSTLVRALAKRGLIAADRGAPTKMTDDPSVKPNPNEFYVILDAPVEFCRQRLQLAGESLVETYHTVEDLSWYRRRFLEVAASLDQCVVIDASGSAQDVLAVCLTRLRERGLVA